MKTAFLQLFVSNIILLYFREKFVVNGEVRSLRRAPDELDNSLGGPSRGSRTFFFSVGPDSTILNWRHCAAILSVHNGTSWQVLGEEVGLDLVNSLEWQFGLFPESEGRDTEAVRLCLSCGAVRGPSFHPACLGFSDASLRRRRGSVLGAFRAVAPTPTNRPSTEYPLAELSTSPLSARPVWALPVAPSALFASAAAGVTALALCLGVLALRSPGATGAYRDVPSPGHLQNAETAPARAKANEAAALSAASASSPRHAPLAGPPSCSLADDPTEDPRNSYLSGQNPDVHSREAPAPASCRRDDSIRPDPTPPTVPDSVRQGDVCGAASRTPCTSVVVKAPTSLVVHVTLPPAAAPSAAASTPPPASRVAVSIPSHAAAGADPKDLQPPESDPKPPAPEVITQLPHCGTNLAAVFSTCEPKIDAAVLAPTSLATVLSSYPLPVNQPVLSATAFAIDTTSDASSVPSSASAPLLSPERIFAGAARGLQMPCVPAALAQRGAVQEEIGVAVSLFAALSGDDRAGVGHFLISGNALFRHTLPSVPQSGSQGQGMVAQTKPQSRRPHSDNDSTDDDVLFGVDRLLLNHWHAVEKARGHRNGQSLRLTAEVRQKRRAFLQRVKAAPHQRKRDVTDADDSNSGVNKPSIGQASSKRQRHGRTSADGSSSDCSTDDMGFLTTGRRRVVNVLPPDAMVALSRSLAEQHSTLHTDERGRSISSRTSGSSAVAPIVGQPQLPEEQEDYLSTDGNGIGTENPAVSQHPFAVVRDAHTYSSKSLPWIPAKDTATMVAPSSAEEIPVVVDANISTPLAPSLGHYERLLRMGVPLAAVQLRMRNDGVDPTLLNGSSASESTGGKHKPSATMSAETQAVLCKYAKMLFVGVPPTAVSVKMTSDGIERTLQDLVLSGQITEAPQNPSNSAGFLGALKTARSSSVQDFISGNPMLVDTHSITSLPLSQRVGDDHLSDGPEVTSLWNETVGKTPIRCKLSAMEGAKNDDRGDSFNSFPLATVTTNTSTDGDVCEENLQPLTADDTGVVSSGSSVPACSLDLESFTNAFIKQSPAHSNQNGLLQLAAVSSVRSDTVVTSATGSERPLPVDSTQDAARKKGRTVLLDPKRAMMAGVALKKLRLAGETVKQALLTLDMQSGGSVLSPEALSLLQDQLTPSPVEQKLIASFVDANGAEKLAEVERFFAELVGVHSMTDRLELLQERHRLPQDVAILQHRATLVKMASQDILQAGALHTVLKQAGVAAQHLLAALKPTAAMASITAAPTLSAIMSLRQIKPPNTKDKQTDALQYVLAEIVRGAHFEEVKTIGGSVREEAVSSTSDAAHDSTPAATRTGSWILVAASKAVDPVGQKLIQQFDTDSSVFLPSTLDSLQSQVRRMEERIRRAQALRQSLQKHDAYPSHTVMGTDDPLSALLQSLLDETQGALQAHVSMARSLFAKCLRFLGEDIHHNKDAASVPTPSRVFGQLADLIAISMRVCRAHKADPISDLLQVANASSRRNPRASTSSVPGCSSVGAVIHPPVRVSSWRSSANTPSSPSASTTSRPAVPSFVPRSPGAGPGSSVAPAWAVRRSARIAEMAASGATDAGSAVASDTK